MAKEQYKLVQEFNTTYWGGLDVQIYAGDIWLKNAVQCNYQLLEVVRPYNHYSSYSPTRIHLGTRIIQGELTMNFTRDSYIFNLLQHLATLNPETGMLPRSNAKHNADGTQTADPVLFNVYPWGPQSGRKVLTENFTGDQAKAYVEARIKQKQQQERQLAANVPSVKEDQGIFQTRPGGFDLNLVFGAFLAQPMTLTYNNNEQDYKLDGAIFQDLRPNPAPIGTGIKLVGVEIMSQARSAVDDGRPLMETYSFLARDIRILSMKDIADFPSYNNTYSNAAEAALGPTTTLDELQKFLGTASSLSQLAG
jgi:hypothetical protein